MCQLRLQQEDALVGVPQLLSQVRDLGLARAAVVVALEPRTGGERPSHILRLHDRYAAQMPNNGKNVYNTQLIFNNAA